MSLIHHQILSFLPLKYLSNYLSLSVLTFTTLVYAAIIFVCTSTIALDWPPKSLFAPLISLLLESSLKNTTLIFLVSCFKLLISYCPQNSTQNLQSVFFAYLATATMVFQFPEDIFFYFFRDFCRYCLLAMLSSLGLIT